MAATAANMTAVTTATRPISGRQGTRRRPNGEHIPDGYQKFFERLSQLDVPVVAIRDNPWLAKSEFMCTYLSTDLGSNGCLVPRSLVLDDDAIANDLEKLPDNVHYIDMSDAYCDEQNCWTVKDNLMIYRDSHHLTATYAQHLAKGLGQKIDRAVGQ